MDDQTKLSILQSKQQCSVLITTKSDSEKQVFIEKDCFIISRCHTKKKSVSLLSLKYDVFIV